MIEGELALFSVTVTKTVAGLVVQVESLFLYLVRRENRTFGRGEQSQIASGDDAHCRGTTAADVSQATLANPTRDVLARMVPPQWELLETGGSEGKGQLVYKG